MKKNTPPSPRIGIVALSSVIPKIEFEHGVDTLRSHGWHVEVHPEVSGQYYFYPAPDEARARAFLDFAKRPDLNAIWCARGGYGATHLLPILEKLTAKKKPPKKTLLGFSDVTALHEFVRRRWGWKTIHAPMPSLKTFSNLSAEEKGSYQSLLLRSLAPQQRPAIPPFELEWIHPLKKAKITAPVVGGNLAVWLALTGTRYAPQARGKILFFEEVGENVARINRYLHQLEQAGGLAGVQAIVLGDFTDCHDTVPMRTDPTDPERRRLIPLRAAYPDAEALQFVFQDLARRTKIPVAYGLPIGHGSQHHSLALGENHTLTRFGQLSLI